MSYSPQVFHEGITGLGTTLAVGAVSDNDTTPVQAISVSGAGVLHAVMLLALSGTNPECTCEIIIDGDTIVSYGDQIDNGDNKPIQTVFPLMIRFLATCVVNFKMSGTSPVGKCTAVVTYA